MAAFKVHFYADGATPLRTDELHVADVHQAQNWASGRLAQSHSFNRARVYDGEAFLSEAGFRINRP